MTKKIALITGVTGQDGFFLTEKLLATGFKVVGISRDLSSKKALRYKARFSDSDVSLIRKNLLDMEEIGSVLASISPVQIYHLASQSSVANSFARPVDTIQSCTSITVNLLEAMKNNRISASFTHASSGEIFSQPVGRVSEDTRFSPSSPYGVGKTAATQIVELYRNAYGINAANAFLFNHESSLRDEYFVSHKIIDHAWQCKFNKPSVMKYGNLDIIRDWGAAEEYMDAMLRICSSETCDDYVVGTGVGYSLREFVDFAFDFFGLDYREFVESDEGLFRPSELSRSVADPTKIERGLGWKASLTLPLLVNKLCQDMVEERES